MSDTWTKDDKIHQTLRSTTLLTGCECLSGRSPTVLSLDLNSFDAHAFCRPILRRLLLLVSNLAAQVVEACTIVSFESVTGLTRSVLEEEFSSNLTNFPCFGDELT